MQNSTKTSGNIRRLTSKSANVELISAVDMEIAQVNILHSQEKTPSSMTSSRAGFPFVCVLMLSNMEDTKGGETCFRGPSGEIKKIDTFPMVRK